MARNFFRSLELTRLPICPLVCGIRQGGTSLSFVSVTTFDATSTDKRRTETNLENVLRTHALVHEDGTLFWSELLLEELITPARVRKQLGMSDVTGGVTDGQVEGIIADYRKIFAILTWIGQEKEVRAMMHEGISDHTLPLAQVDPINCQLADSTTPEQPLSCFTRWNYAQREGFHRVQRQVNPVYLDLEPDGKTIKHRAFDTRVLMPFLEEEYRQSGGYGTIYRVKIHKHCHGFQNVLRVLSTDDYFALKKIPQSQNEPSKEELKFWKEVDALKRFSGFVHDHLVTLLMTWTTKNPRQYCLLFPWAGNDLDFYWEQNNPPINGVNPDIGVVRWIAKQITGMAGALDAIHNPRYDDTHLKPKKKYGRHGDIKPENILWYDCPNDERGIWVIADLGLTAFNTTNSRSNVPGEGIPVSPGYRPPECDLEGGVISQAFDIWTFGCLLLEMVCWALGGQTNRAQFKAHRMTPYITGIGSNIFFSIDSKGQGRGFAIGVKRQVSEWIAHLHGRTHCTEFFHELLDLIEEEMIVALSADQKRIKSAALLERLRAMYSRVVNPADSYCQYPRPRKCEPRYRDPVDAILNKHALGLVDTRSPSLVTHSGKIQVAMTRDELSAMED